MRATASVLGLMTLIDADPRFTTQTSPFGATAIVRGPLPTAIAATRLFVARSMTPTVSLSGLATHRRAEAPARVSTASADELVGGDAVFEAGHALHQRAARGRAVAGLGRQRHDVHPRRHEGVRGRRRAREVAVGSPVAEIPRVGDARRGGQRVRGRAVRSDDRRRDRNVQVRRVVGGRRHRGRRDALPDRR